MYKVVLKLLDKRFCDCISHVSYLQIGKLKLAF
jgi:hypothetical protein